MHDGRRLILATRLILAVRRSALRRVGRVADQADAITRAVDVLMAGVERARPAPFAAITRLQVLYQGFIGRVPTARPASRRSAEVSLFRVAFRRIPWPATIENRRKTR